MGICCAWDAGWLRSSLLGFRRMQKKNAKSSLNAGKSTLPPSPSTCCRLQCFRFPHPWFAFPRDTRGSTSVGEYDCCLAQPSSSGVVKVSPPRRCNVQNASAAHGAANKPQLPHGRARGVKLVHQPCNSWDAAESLPEERSGAACCKLYQYLNYVRGI